MTTFGTYTAGREARITAHIENIEKEAKDIMERFAQFTHGTRVVMTLLRAKEGGHKNEYKRRRYRAVSNTPKELHGAILTALLLLRTVAPWHRVYMSVSPRSLRNAELTFKRDMLETDFTGEGTNKQAFWERIEDKWVGCLMESNPPKGEGLFIIDVDATDNAPQLHWCAQNDVEIVMAYRTKNGWHLVTKPFNRSIWPAELGEVKDDALLLLAW